MGPVLCYHTWRRGTKVADGIKIAKQLILRQGDYPDFPSEPNVITEVLRGGRRRRKDQKQRRRCDDGSKVRVTERI